MWSRSKYQYRKVRYYTDDEKDTLIAGSNGWTNNYRFRTSAHDMKVDKEQFPNKRQITHPQYRGHFPGEIGRVEHGQTVHAKSVGCFGALRKEEKHRKPWDDKRR